MCQCRHSGVHSTHIKKEEVFNLNSLCRIYIWFCSNDMSIQRACRKDGGGGGGGGSNDSVRIPLSEMGH